HGHSVHYHQLPHAVQRGGVDWLPIARTTCGVESCRHQASVGQVELCGFILKAQGVDKKLERRQCVAIFGGGVCGACLPSRRVRLNSRRCSSENESEHEQRRADKGKGVSQELEEAVVVHIRKVWTETRISIVSKMMARPRK